MSQRWRHEDAAHHSTLTLNKVRAVIELRHEEGAGRSTLTLRKVRAVLELRHESKPQEGAGLAHQSRRRTRDFGKSPRNLMSGSETVCANFGIYILSHLLEHSLYTVLHLKHLNFGLYIETPKFTRGSRGREQTARPSGRRHRVATRGGCRPQPECNQWLKRGSQAVFRTDEYLTLGWIQPRDKPVSGFDSMGPNGPDPCLTPG